MEGLLKHAQAALQSTSVAGEDSELFLKLAQASRQTMDLNLKQGKIVCPRFNNSRPDSGLKAGEPGI